jgi:hypothetical protein
MVRVQDLGVARFCRCLLWHWEFNYRLVIGKGRREKRSKDGISRVFLGFLYILIQNGILFYYPLLDGWPLP